MSRLSWFVCDVFENQLVPKRTRILVTFLGWALCPYVLCPLFSAPKSSELRVRDVTTSSPKDIWVVQGGNTSFLKQPHSSIQKSVWSWCHSSVVEHECHMYDPGFGSQQQNMKENLNQHGHVYHHERLLTSHWIFLLLTVLRVCSNQAMPPLGGRTLRVEYSQWSISPKPISKYRPMEQGNICPNTIRKIRLTSWFLHLTRQYPPTHPCPLQQLCSVWSGFSPFKCLHCS